MSENIKKIAFILIVGMVRAASGALSQSDEGEYLGEFDGYPEFKLINIQIGAGKYHINLKLTLLSSDSTSPTQFIKHHLSVKYLTSEI